MHGVANTSESFPTFLSHLRFEFSFCVVMLGLTNVNILYYSFSTLYQMCNLRYNHIRVCDFFP